MSEPFLAEVRIFGFNFAPRGWAQCDGQILAINQNQSLYSLLGTIYGGDGRTTFALPDLRGRTPIHVGASNGVSHPQGQKSGEERHTLSAAEIPQHGHVAQASEDNADSGDPVGRVLARSTSPTYQPPESLTALSSLAVSAAGGGQAHDNMMPYQALNFCIALQGLFPSRN
jgi:microcystin-dependent protein